MYNIKDITYFKGLSTKSYEKINDRLFIKQYNKDSIVFFEGDSSEYLYILLEGKVNMYKTTPKGSKIHIDFLDAPSLIGEFACFEEMPYPATCEFITNGVVGLLPFKIVKELLSEQDFSLSIIRSLTSKVMILSALVHKETVLSSEAKVADIILRQNTIFSRLKNSEIASMLNLTPETFSRILTKFKKESLISISNHQLIIIDRDRLITLVDTNKIKECTDCILQFKKEHGFD